MIEINYSKGKDKNIDPAHLKRLDRNNHAFIHEYVKYCDGFDDISSIEIETISGCNNTCSFCPINIHNDRRQRVVMEEEIFKKFIDELAVKEYTGYISYFSNNEPLMDKRILDFIRYGKEKLPKAYHSLFTNGILLTEEKFQSLTAVLDRLTIDNYSNELKLHVHIEEILQKHPDVDCDVSVFVCKKDNVLDSRAGNAPNREVKDVFTGSCILPFTQLILKPNGDMTICCQDAFGDKVLGNLKEQSLDEVLYGERRMQILDELENGRTGIHPCNRCDLFGMTNYHMKPWFYYRMRAAHAEALLKALAASPYDQIYFSGKRDEITDRICQFFQVTQLPISYGNGDGFKIYASYENAINEMGEDPEKIGKEYLVVDILYYMEKERAYERKRDPVL